MRKTVPAVLILAMAAGAAAAQDSNFGIAAGLKAWSTQWTTWGYEPTVGGGRVITEALTNDKTVLVPIVSVRYRDFIGSVSAITSTTYSYPDGDTVSRKEHDVNLGYFIAPGVAATVGYKSLAQWAGPNNFKLAGPTIGLSATAPLSGAFSLYGALGLGRMKPKGNVDLDADYQLSEVGGAYGLALGGIAKSLTFTVGYRTQVLKSKEALPGQDARDLTQGFTFGLVAAF
ncbi:MAG: hypothetical protein HZC37_17055 [Burkholderiales bacterium]|nr:hypothetical protein [Burkholderiales bacterium]